MIKKQASCTDIFESGLLPVEQALKQIMSALPRQNNYQVINIEKAKGRTLFEPVTAPFNVPRHNNSAVDGYGINLASLSSTTAHQLSVVGSAFAGKPYKGQPIQQGECIRIMTGAIIPDQVNCVLMQEHVELHNNTIVFDQSHKAGQNIRLAGEDIKQQEVILQKGRVLNPADIGLIASLGIAEIKVKAKLKIAIASTGNEICNIGDKDNSDKIYDSNRYTLTTALDRADIELTQLGIVEDSPEALLQCFNQASLYADMIISTGGVSVGDADHTKNALKSSGKVDFWKIAIKPGRPLAFGKIGNSVFFGLPGNPVAVMVTFYQFVLPAIEQILGITDKPISPLIKAISLEDIRKKPGRSEIVRGILHQQNEQWVIKTTGKQGSGILRSMSLANAFIRL